MTAEQLVEWQAFIDLEGPIGERRQDIRTAHVVSTLANLHGRDPKTTPDPYRIDDFVLRFSEDDRKAAEPKPQDEAAMKHIAKQIAFAFADNPPDPPSPAPPPRRTRRKPSAE